MDLGSRSANVSHWQSVGREESGDKLGGVTARTAEPLESN
jgi:hypothetical protein